MNRLIEVSDKEFEDIWAELLAAGYTKENKSHYWTFFKKRGDRTNFEHSKTRVRATCGTDGHTIIFTHLGKPNVERGTHGTQSCKDNADVWFLNGRVK